MKKHKRNLIAFFLAVIVLHNSRLGFVAEAAEYSHTYNPSNIVVSGSYSGYTMRANISATAKFTTNSSNYVTGKSLTMSFSNLSNIATISQSSNTTTTSGSYSAYVKRTFTATNGNYYGSGNLKITCSSSSSGTTTTYSIDKSFTVSYHS